jgi:leucyl/phenylalanyl-tRNA--protein transferase
VPVFRLTREIVFPDPSLAEEDGILAVGGDLSPGRLLQAYELGIFPWFNEGSPILWWSPDPRLVLYPEELHVSSSLARTLRRGTYRVTADTAFGQVIRGCARSERKGQDGTWITDEMIGAYEELHRLGYAHSFEAWSGDTLAGGLYGVSLGGAFFGESMYSDRTDASKVAFVRSIELFRRSGIELVDCQVRTEHLVRLGAREIPRTDFLDRLSDLLGKPTLPGRWDLGPAHGGGAP